MALLVDSLTIPSWACRMIEAMQRDGKSDVCLVVLNGAVKKKSWRSRIPSAELWRSLVYTAHRKADRFLSGSKFDPFAPRNLEDLLPGIEVINASPRQTKYSDYLPTEVCEKIRTLEVDLCIRLGFRILRGEILTAAKYGVWSLHHGDEAVNRGGPPGFWEVMGGWPVTGATLQILTEDLDAGLIVSKTFSTTDPSFVTRNKQGLYWGSAPLLARAVSRLQDMGGESFIQSLRGRRPRLRFYSRKLYRAPQNMEALRILGGHLARVVQRKVRERTKALRWALLYAHDASGGLTKSMRKMQLKQPPDGCEWADPFVIFKDDEYYVFFEEFSLKRGKAHISCLVYSPQDGWTNSREVLRREYHLSYPFVFELEDAFYMIPETAEAGAIELYRATTFPYEWEFVQNVMEDVQARDTTLLFRDGKWWLFTCVQEYREMSSWQELFLFYSDDLFAKKWTAHPLNPIVSDARSARPAGSFFEENGFLYRPSQDCGGCYGRSVKLNRVVVLTEQEYEEECVDQIEPNWNPRVERIHTLNHCQGLTLIDGLVSSVST